MGSTIFAVFLPLALALVMFGLGLTLTREDFARVVKYPRAAVVALVCQIVVVPLVCLGLIFLFGLTGALAVGMMLLVAAPGGTAANLFSHMAGGDVALNITLTAINSVLAIFTMPIVVTLAIAGFMDADTSIGLQPSKFVQVLAIVLIPVAIGMRIRHSYTDWAERMRKPVKVGSVVVLVLVLALAFLSQYETLRDDAFRLAAITLTLAVVSMLIGYFVPRLFRVSVPQSIASTMEIGIHNGTLAIAIAVSALDNETMAIPAAIYGTLIFLPVSIAAYVLARRTKVAAQPVGA